MTNYLNLPIGENAPECVECVVEVPKDTNTKYEYDEKLNIFRLDRCLLSSMNYPASYGFIPSTHADDGDALDMLVFNSAPLLTGTVVTCRVVGVLNMTDGGKKDYKLLGIPVFNPNRYADIEDIDPMFLKITRNFFKYYKELEGKSVEIDGWYGKQAAYEIIMSGHQTYRRRMQLEE